MGVWEIIKTWFLSRYNLDQKLFVCKLAFCQPYRKYAITALRKDQVELLHDLEKIGVIYFSNTPNDEYFCPTYLHQGLLYNNSDNINDNDNGTNENESDESERFLIIESNYKIYAYTKNSHHIDILSYFADHSVCPCLPNFHTYTLTRNSVQQAIDQRISSELIISYLKNRIHTKQENASISRIGGAGDRFVIPPVVTDSIRLWGMEK